jgi:hypothetical protein
LIAARWEYETTPISERGLAAKFGLSRSAIHAWIVQQGWRKAEVLRSYPGEAGQQQLQRDIRAAIRAASERKIVQGLERAVVGPPVGNVAKVTKVATPGEPGAMDVDGAREMSRDRPPASQNTPAAEPFGKPRTGDRAGQVVHLAGTNWPLQSLKTKPTTAFPPRSRTEQAAIRVRLASQCGELALQQIQQLDQHEELLSDYQHLLAVSLNPGKFVDTAGLESAQAAAKLEAISRQAGRRVMPSERDTLSGTILALTKALLNSFAASGPPPA